MNPTTRRHSLAGSGLAGAFHPSRLPALALAAVGAAALGLVGLIFFWMSDAAMQISAQGADNLTIRAVLRADVDGTGAEILAGRIRQQIPSGELEVITETQGRALLALQEPWIAQMPDFEVTPLPNLVEIQHPDLLTNPARVQQFVKELQEEPEVDFVAYNEAAHNRLLKLASSIDGVRKHSLRWVWGGLMLAGGALFLFLGWHLPGGSYAADALAAAAVWLVAAILAAAVFQMWEGPLEAAQTFTSLKARTMAGPAGGSFLLALGACLAGTFWKCRRR